MNNNVVAVAGASGMLGSMVLEVLSRKADFNLIATVRSGVQAKELEDRYRNVEWRILDAEDHDTAKLTKLLCDAQWIINAIGKIKPYIHDDDPEEIEHAARVNAIFPHLLARAAARNGTRVIQIATDCVYSGSKGAYIESDPHDALDVYGKTKSLGEVFLENASHIRCSIIGPESKDYVSLLEWFRRQPLDAELNGFTNHRWNGITTFHYAMLCHGIIYNSVKLPHVQHVVPGGMISKFELLKCFVREYERDDITINPFEAQTVIDRTLATENDALNRDLWAAAGYSEPPTVPEMVAEMANFNNNKS
ncbi:MAG: sugar nucleotide-binding protein [Candidatus Latescibacteria bacterium]|jgi:dTDP-4-dehydrorhamnose reductase|nr:sugar nucleotide-binding protein [Candidatus Latescibacterota bacterium]